MAKRPSATRARGGRHPAAQAMLLRQLHAYLSAFVAPAVLFFALTGAVQLFSLHEAHGDYQPPPLIEKLGMVHKDQKFALKPKRRPALALGAPVLRHDAEPASGPTHDEGDWIAPAKAPPADGPRVRELALKWVFLAAALSLTASTLLGLWMGFTQNRRKWWLIVLFLAGAAIPVAILAL